MNNSVIIFICLSVFGLCFIFGLWLLYHLLSQKLDQILSNVFLSQRPNLSHDMLQRKLQAYERLSLLMERIQFPNVIKRCHDGNMTALQLINMMKMDIQTEFEHNVTQQIYVSDQLWEIISLTKNDVFATLNDLSNDLEEYQSDQVFVGALIDKLDQKKFNPIDKALLAIRKEVSSLS